MAENVETSWWNHRVLEMHHKRLSQVKSTMNMKDSSHLRAVDSRKRQFLRQQQEAKIEHENKKLVSNMMEIVAKAGKEYRPKPPVKIYSRAEATRRKQNQEIARENYTLAMRIINQKPSMNVKKLEKEFQEHERIVANRAFHTKNALLVQQFGTTVGHENQYSPRNRAASSSPRAGVHLEPLPEAQRQKAAMAASSAHTPRALLSNASPPRGRRNLAPISSSKAAASH